MLTIHQAQSPKKKQPTTKTGLAIAGGGPVGAIYELGALRALDESIDGLRLHELDVYVGVSSGAIIAASLATEFQRWKCAGYLRDRSTPASASTPSV